ncbi:hypothetical protein TNCV_329601 [Trichonephila clavipes]|nr:hypothetical protein TNCV_329601 [Trichonephila clavipes]
MPGVRALVPLIHIQSAVVQNRHVGMERKLGQRDASSLFLKCHSSLDHGSELRGLLKKAVTPKRFGGPSVDRDRLNAHPWLKRLKSSGHRMIITSHKLNAITRKINDILSTYR